MGKNPDSPWYVFVTALMYLYMQLHGYQEHSLDEMAFKDSLTGVKNHAAYSRIKEKMESKLQQDGNHRFAIAVMDVNNLKQVNDAIGHKAGDALIISAAKLLCDVFAHSPVCRIGGDEFVAISKKGKTYAPIKAESEPDSISIKSGYVAYNSGRDIILTNRSGSKTKRATCDSDIRQIHIIDSGKVLAVYSSSIQFKKMKKSDTESVILLPQETPAEEGEKVE